MRDDYVEESLMSAVEGRRIWILLKGKYNVESDSGIVLFPSEDMELNKIAIAVLKPHKERFRLGKILAVTDNCHTYDRMSGLGEGIYRIKIHADEMKKLLCYYRAVPFWTNIVNVMLEEPYGNNCFMHTKQIDGMAFVQSAVFKWG